ncbi:MAG: type II secretion system protein [bacterium]
MMKNSERGVAFTLIELLIVVAIIGILASIAVPNFINALTRAKVARVLSEENSLRDAYTEYRLDHSAWPPHFHGLGQHRYVTTPVAYLTTSISDQFLVASGEGEYQQVLAWFGGQYHMEPSCLWSPGSTGEWGAVFAQEPYFWNRWRATAFYANSLGPDRDYDYGVPYAATNGLASSGEILTPIAAEFTEGYPFTTMDSTQ